MCRICRARLARRGGVRSDVFVAAGVVDDDDEGPCAAACEVDAPPPRASASGGRSASAAAAAPTHRVVVGAGVAGVCCAEELARLRPDDVVTLVALGDAVQSVRDVERVTRKTRLLDVVDRPASSLERANLRVLRAEATALDPDAKTLHVRPHAPNGEPPNADARAALRYDQLCVCSGAEPVTPSEILDVVDDRDESDARRAAASSSSPSPSSSTSSRAAVERVCVTVRDAASVDALADRLRGARRVLLAGNGGIALELAGALCGGFGETGGGGGCGGGGENAPPSFSDGAPELVWAAKHRTVGDSFFDRDAAAFLLDVASARGLGLACPLAGAEEIFGSDENAFEPSRADPSQAKETPPPPRASRRASSCASAGPSWVARLRASARGASRPFRLRLLPERSVASIREWSSRDEKAAEKEKVAWPAAATLSDGEVLGVDLVVVAAGVRAGPRVAWLPRDRFARAEDGALAVDGEFRCLRPSPPLESSPASESRAWDSVFAAGDCASTSRGVGGAGEDASCRWFQMRLWSQAAASGAYAARVMAGEADELASGFNFELFTHATRFLGQKVVLLGCYNGQGLEGEPESDVVTYARSDDPSAPNPRFVRVLLLRGRMAGAALVGETDLEETFENLILDGVDLSSYGPSLLDPDVDVEDYFD